SDLTIHTDTRPGGKPVSLTAKRNQCRHRFDDPMSQHLCQSIAAVIGSGNIGSRRSRTQNHPVTVIGPSVGFHMELTLLIAYLSYIFAGLHLHLTVSGLHLKYIPDAGSLLAVRIE